LCWPSFEALENGEAGIRALRRGRTQQEESQVGRESPRARKRAGEATTRKRETLSRRQCPRCGLRLSVSSLERPTDKRRQPAQGARAILLRQQGLTLQAIGKRLGVTKQRVQQLLATAGESSQRPGKGPGSGSIAALSDRALWRLFLPLEELPTMRWAERRLIESRLRLVGDVAVHSIRELDWLHGFTDAAIGELEVRLSDWGLGLRLWIPDWPALRKLAGAFKLPRRKRVLEPRARQGEARWVYPEGLLETTPVLREMLMREGSAVG
jgi:hypothetical protein